MPEHQTDTQAALALTEAATILEHAQRCQGALAPAEGYLGHPVILVPRGWSAERLRDWEPAVPDRIRQNVILRTENDFLIYLNAFKAAESLIFAKTSKAAEVSFMAVLDYHSKAAPSACVHRVHFVPERSVEWIRWEGANGRAMSQSEFAIFLENNSRDVVVPSGADLLQIINEFEVEGTLMFQKVQRQQSGSVRFHFQNEQRAKAGELEVPEMFHLRLTLFEGEAMVDLEARLRYRLSQGGELKLWFELVNPHLVVRAAVEQLADSIQTNSGIPVLEGKPD